MAKLRRSSAATAEKPQAPAQVKGKEPTAAWKKWDASHVLERLDVPQGSEDAVMAYIKKNLPGLKKDAPKAIDITPEDYIVESIQNAINDGHIEFKGGEDGDGGEIIPVSQEALKRALKTLLTRRSSVIAHLYEKHEEFNQQYFAGQLSTPVITIDRLSNRTLGNYTEGEDSSGLRNHIRFNQNFIALQLEDDNMERILETLKHEMIHQWQDEVMYAQRGENSPTKTVTILRKDENGNIGYVEVVQKKRPKEWHNKDFRDMAACVGIPAIGAKCHGNPCRMPEAKSYNRKFICGCVASNGYPVTVWSTRPINAVCMTCKNRFVEVGKDMTKGKVIPVTMSHIEKKGQDAVQEVMKAKFEHFERFATRDEKELFVSGITGELEQGVYQKNHNAYHDGFRYWVAFNGTHPSKVKPKDSEGGKTPMRRRKPQEAAAEDEIAAGMQQSAPAATEPRTYSADNPQDIIDLYREEGSTRKVAERIGIAQSTLMGRIKKFEIDFNKGRYKLPQ